MKKSDLFVNNVIVRKATEKDYDFVLNQNEKNVSVLSPMNTEQLQTFAKITELFLIAEKDNYPVAFLFALRENNNVYKSQNYLWFNQNYSRFLYIDRIVIDKNHRNSGIGKKMYNAVFEHAKVTKVHYVTAEIDLIPYNKTSLAFHKALGFKEVGTQFVRNNTVKVSLQEYQVKGNF